MNFCDLGLAVIQTEAQAILDLSPRIDASFHAACECLLACQGRIVVTGMGKSGHIARKIAATFASTGSPAFFMHPGEACHGDLGMITRQDIVVALSNSGYTEELLILLPLLKRLEVPLIAVTGNPYSTLATTATVHLNASIRQEACPLGLAPTASTTVALVMGDALAISLLQARGFSANDFALSHPKGTLGKRLLLRIDDIFHQREDMPIVTEETTIRKALMEVSAKKLGMTCVVNAKGLLTGVYTDGDIRRTLMNTEYDIDTTPIQAVMTVNPRVIQPGLLAAEALTLMQKHAITSLIVVNEQNQPHGVLHLHDLLKAGVY
jgi:arabinose-5-phosphate isomerase